MTRPQIYTPPDWCPNHGPLPEGHEAPRTGTRINVYALFLVLMAFIAGGVFAIWQQAHWIVTNTPH